MLGPVESAIFTNQQTASVASEKNVQQARFDLQNAAAAETVNGKKKEVEEVRPAEENQKVDEDREHQKNEADQETARAEHEDREDEEEVVLSSPLHILDIKV
jgi:hypothetical protein